MLLLVNGLGIHAQKSPKKPYIGGGRTWNRKQILSDLKFAPRRIDGWFCNHNLMA